jgi:hypothetical protein
VVVEKECVQVGNTHKGGGAVLPDGTHSVGDNDACSCEEIWSVAIRGECQTDCFRETQLKTIRRLVRLQTAQGLFL